MKNMSGSWTQVMCFPKRRMDVALDIRRKLFDDILFVRAYHVVIAARKERFPEPKPIATFVSLHLDTRDSPSEKPCSKFVSLCPQFVAAAFAHRSIRTSFTTIFSGQSRRFVGHSDAWETPPFVCA